MEESWNRVKVSECQSKGLKEVMRRNAGRDGLIGAEMQKAKNAVASVAGIIMGKTN